MGRSPCCEKVGLKKGPWTPEEDQKLLAFIEVHGHGSWRALPAKAGLQRCGKSCRLRWTNYLRPDIKRGKFSLQEEQTIIQLHALLGNRWSAIATHLPKRTDNEIKNYWNTHLKKRLAKMGIDPVTHKPKSDALSSADGQSKNAANLSHMAQWESARLEAEVRLVRESKLRSVAATTNGSLTSPTTGTTCHDVLRTWKGVWSKTNKGGGGSIDLESPTSTLRFSDNNNNIRVQAVEELSDWKCLSKSMRALDVGVGNKSQTTTRTMEHFSGFPLEPSIFGGGGETPWSMHEALKQGSGNFGDGFTEMLLEKYSDEQNSSSDYCRADDSSNGDNLDGGAGGVGHENEEENNSYWNSILNLVNSGSASGAPPLF